MKKLVPFLGFLVFLTSCGPGRYMTSTLTRYDISKVTIIEPESFITYIDKNDFDRERHDVRLSDIAASNVLEGTQDYLSDYYLVENLYLDSASRRIVFHETGQLMEYCKSAYSVEEIPFPPALDSLMWSNEIDYAVCMLHHGFSRDKSNYRRQIAWGFFSELFFGVGYYPTKSLSDLMICILDRRNQKVAFYNRKVMEDREPYDRRTTDRQIERIFDKYFED